MAIKLAANLSFMFQERPFLERFGAAAAAGFKAVEFGSHAPVEFTKEQLVAAKDAAGVEVINISAPKGGADGKGFAALFDRHSDFIASLNTGIECAVALKCPRIHVLAGFIDEAHQEKAESTYIANIQHAAKECAKHGITVLIEPLYFPTYFLRHQPRAVELLKKIGCSNVKIEFDTYHAQTMDGNLVNFLTNNFECVGHIQVSQVPGRHEPDENGEINFPFFFKTLLSLGYNGWIGCEYLPAGKTEDGLGWAKQYLGERT